MLLQFHSKSTQYSTIAQPWFKNLKNTNECEKLVEKYVNIASNRKGIMVNH